MSTNQVPRERLNQIAARKLAALSIPAKVDTDGVTLKGQLTFGPNALKNPFNGQVIEGAGFRVSGHDHLIFLTAPLAALGPVPFYDCPETTALTLRLQQLLGDRLRNVQSAASRLKSLKLPVDLDAEQAVARVLIDATSHHFEITADGRDLWVTRAATRGGKPVTLLPGTHALNVPETSSPAELGIFLVQVYPDILAASQRAAAPVEAPAPPPPTLQVTPPAANELALSTLNRFAADMTVTSPGIELTQTFFLGDQKIRFIATHIAGTTFKARLVTAQGEKWSDKIDLMRFPGALPLVNTVFAKALETPTRPTASPQASAQPPETAPSSPTNHLAPVAGEVWVMNVLIESEDGNDIRYVCTDIDGKPYGAARVLPRKDFETIFAPTGGSWRLYVVLEEVAEGTVRYRQLDRARVPRGTQKSMKLPTLLVTFLPEAAVY